jgi:hypothetical protein
MGCVEKLSPHLSGSLQKADIEIEQREWTKKAMTNTFPTLGELPICWDGDYRSQRQIEHFYRRQDKIG